MSTDFKKAFAEFFGTFCLVFCGTGAVVINDAGGGVITHAGVGLTFGLVVLAMIYSLGDISGAHLNPAVTTGFFLARRMEGRKAACYIAAQLAGAFAASGTLRFLFPLHRTLGATLPAGPSSQSFVLEVLLTLILMFVILSVSTGEKEKGITAGIAIGSVIALEAIFAGPVSSASMNPARSIAPAVVSESASALSALWLYILAPIVGATLAVPLCICLREKGCCCPGVAKEPT